jgi:signal transduction histidine kinase
MLRDAAIITPWKSTRAEHGREAVSAQEFFAHMFSDTKVRKPATFLTRLSRGGLMLVALAMFAAVAFVDYATGYEVTVFPFYSIPILFAMWTVGSSQAILIAVLSTLSWWWADTMTGHPYSQEWYQVWDAVVRLIFFLLVIFAGNAVRQQRDANRARIDLLERSQELEREIISISEREQQRIGHDLHDGLGQYLVAIGLVADSLRDDLEKKSAGHTADQAGKVADLLHKAVINTRDIARGLSPVDMDEGGLESALEDLAATTTELSGISCSFLCDGPLLARNTTRDLHLFRIAQEALNNAVKHARPKVVVIVLEAVDGGLSLRVSDDGVGLPIDLAKSSGMGFNIMRYRARVIGGELDIQPNSPTGTVVTCAVKAAASIPRNEELIVT